MTSRYDAAKPPAALLPSLPYLLHLKWLVSQPACWLTPVTQAFMHGTASHGSPSVPARLKPLPRFSQATELIPQLRVQLWFTFWFVVLVVAAVVAHRTHLPVAWVVALAELVRDLENGGFAYLIWARLFQLP
jgi:hypothetical protein